MSLPRHERAYAKVNLLLQVGPTRADGLHEICSLFASLELADELVVARGEGSDSVHCPGVEGPNLVATALAAFRRETASELPALSVSVAKLIPVAAGLGGGSADAAAALRAANELSGRPLDAAGLRALGARIGADVPSQVDPRHALVTGAGEHVEPLALPPMALLLVPRAPGLRAGEVYAEADRLGATRATLAPDRVRELAAAPLEELAAGLENDLEAAALSLRPQLERPLRALREAGALAALVTGSGPTLFGVFGDRAAAVAAAARVPGGVVAMVRPS